ncbi:MAG: hypothetical protein EBX25_02675 [Candidatus Fonsibacter ubiquis]|nr:hypothetical protein [Candidatus Fonsibacter ubiquis]
MKLQLIKNTNFNKENFFNKKELHPLFQILKILNQKDKNKYQLKDSSGLVIKISDNLNSILKIISKKCSKRYLKIIK